MHLCSMEGEGRDPAPGVCYYKAALLCFLSPGFFFLREEVGKLSEKSLPRQKLDWTGWPLT